jgi:hypothetical protein
LGKIDFGSAFLIFSGFAGVAAIVPDYFFHNRPTALEGGGDGLILIGE